MNNNEDYVVVEYTEESKKKMHKKSIKIMAVLGITLVVLVVATYAWFVGITTVNVSEFDVNVEALKGLEISFDAADNNWHNGEDDAVQINRGNHNTFGVSNNRWVEPTGLVPVSSPGELANSGHLKFFSNASMESVTGGYYIRTEAIDNTTIASGDTSPEKSQYITFDMFLKNTANTMGVDATGADITKGEAVYLTVDSDAFAKKTQDNPTSTVLEDDPNDEDGLENSVRVGFYEIGYVPLDADSTTISGLKSFSCTGTVTGVTSLCSSSTSDEGQGVSWNIWEPNDVDHETKAVTEFRKCKTRTDVNTYTSTACSPIVDTSSTPAVGNSLHTYAINSEIAINNKVNIYDGLNGYTANTYHETDNPTGRLKDLNSHIKESTNVLDETDPTNPYNTSRDQIIRLMPNAITKVRVYIWLEGQDPDNLSYSASAPKKILIKFGFTKDMYEEESFNQS